MRFKPASRLRRLQQVVSQFRKKLHEKKSGIVAEPTICDEQKFKNLVRQIHTAIDALVDDDHAHVPQLPVLLRADHVQAGLV